jgi:hypothetical protein
VRQKQVILLTGRVHPGESPASWIMRGLVHYLTGRTEAAERLRNQFLFKIVPMLNPDGVIVGNTRLKEQSGQILDRLESGTISL